jgi:uncharacterized protein DUF4331
MHDGSAWRDPEPDPAEKNDSRPNGREDMRTGKVRASLLIAALTGALACAGSSATALAWIPLVEPQGGPYFGKLDPAASYYAMIDNTGDGVEDVSYRWEFRNRFRSPSSALYAVPPTEVVEVNTVPNAQWHDALFT